MRTGEITCRAGAGARALASRHKPQTPQGHQNNHREPHPGEVLEFQTAWKIKFSGDFQVFFSRLPPKSISRERRAFPASTGDMMMEPEDLNGARFLRRAEAAGYVQATYGFPCSRQWLAKLAVVGGGPTFRKAGRTPIYAPRDLDEWALGRIGAPRRSTSDELVPARAG